MRKRCAASSWGFKTSVTAHVFPLVGVIRLPMDSIYQALGFGARYGYVWTQAPLLTGERVVTAHLVQGVVTWSLGDVSIGRFEDHPEKGATVLFEVPLGASIPPSARAHARTSRVASIWCSRCRCDCGRCEARGAAPVAGRCAATTPAISPLA
jgi:hypothetical protein